MSHLVAGGERVFFRILNGCDIFGGDANGAFMHHMYTKVFNIVKSSCS